MKKIILILFVLTFTALFCDDIRVFIDDGTVIEGKLVGEDYGVYFIKSDSLLKKIPLSRITQIDDIEIYHIYDYPHFRLLPVSVIAFTLSWDYFKTVADINETIKEIEKANEYPGSIQQSTGELKRVRFRKVIMGSFFSLAGLINIYFSLERIEVETKVNYIGLRWKF